MLKDYRLAPLNGKPPAHVVIFLHGYGDRGDGGLLEICRVWQRALPDCEFLCPDAPFAFEGAPPEFGGRQWFRIGTFTLDEILAGVKTAAPYLNDYIDHVLATRNLPPERLALAGFSQGTIMSLYVAPRRAQPVACVLGYSGLLIGSETLAAEKKCMPPVFLIHGTADEVVPFRYMGLSERFLKADGFDVSSLACPGLGHSIDDAGLVKGLEFLTAHLRK